MNHHPIQSVTAIVPTLDGNPAKININYCADCRKYFISYDEYTYYLKLYRFIALPFQHTDAPRGSSLSNLKQYSPLSLCGYSVDASRGFTDAERQGILARMILFTPISKWEIMDYLNGFIALGRKNHGKELAVSKWERDLEFVRNFNIDRQRIVRIDEIKRWTSR